MLRPPHLLVLLLPGHHHHQQHGGGGGGLGLVLGLTVARMMHCTPSEDCSLDSNHHAQQQGLALRKELFTSWCAIIIQKQLLFEIVTHPNISSQADLDKSLDLKNLLKRNECSCLVLLSIFKMLRKHFKFVPCFSSCEKLHF